MCHPSNSLPPGVTPFHIVPEWYFLPSYALLKSVPSRGSGFALLSGVLCAPALAFESLAARIFLFGAARSHASLAAILVTAAGAALPARLSAARGVVFPTGICLCA